jgi:hypothetical protein
MAHQTVIGITGARSLNAAQLATVQDITRQAARVGSVYTGCATGADAAALAAANIHAHCFAVGASNGAGFPGRGLPPHIIAAVKWENKITWLAGGPLSVPLVARLARRSLAMVRALALAGGALVAFPASPRPPRYFGPGPFPSCGSGTWATVAAAARLSVPVFVVWPVAPSAVLPTAGAWVQATLFGVACWAFVPAARKML